MSYHPNGARHCLHSHRSFPRVQDTTRSSITEQIGLVEICVGTRLVNELKYNDFHLSLVDNLISTQKIELFSKYIVNVW